MTKGTERTINHAFHLIIVGAFIYLDYRNGVEIGWSQSLMLVLLARIAVATDS